MRQKNFNVTRRRPGSRSSTRTRTLPKPSNRTRCLPRRLPADARAWRGTEKRPGHVQGVELPALSLRPRPTIGSDYVVFTYDDSSPARPRPVIRNRRPHRQHPQGRLEDRQYHDVEHKKRPRGSCTTQGRPAGKTNLAFKDYERSATEEKQFQRLKRKLAVVEKTRLQPLKCEPRPGAQALAASSEPCYLPP